MPIRRRGFLKMLLSVIAGSVAGKTLINGQPLAATPLSARREYGGASLNGWEIALGDALYNRPGEPSVTLDDIETVHHLSSTELLANVNRRVIMAHNITFYRIIDNTALSYVHTCGYKFRLPYIPQPEEDSQDNGQTIEGGIFVWDGGKTQLDYGMAFQWIVNPFPDSNTGHVNAWTNDGWVHVGDLPLDSGALVWHDVQMVVNYPSRATALFIDGQPYQSYLAAVPKIGWGTETAARLQAEIVSIYPEPSGIRATHKAEFKDWYWFWEYRVYMPLVAKPPPTPTPTPTPQPTPISCNLAYFTHPVANQTVSRPFDICWVPDTCGMVLQAYQNGSLIYENKQAASCTRIDIPLGLTELKIWVPGAYAPAHAIWVTVI